MDGVGKAPMYLKKAMDLQPSCLNRAFIWPQPYTGQFFRFLTFIYANDKIRTNKSILVSVLTF